MAKKGAKKKLTIRAGYNKEYSNYLRRIKAQEKKGYFGYIPIPNVKNPTKASIRRIKRIGAKEIREKSPIVISLKTGVQVTRYEKRTEEFERKAESGRRAAETRIRNAEDLRRSFAETFTKEYLPTEQNINANNFVNDVISKVTPRDFFEYLLDRLENSIYDESFYKLKYEKQRLHRANRDVIMRKIESIIVNKSTNKVYYAIINSGKKDELLDAVDKSIGAYEEEDIKTGRTIALQILNMGTLTSKDYDELMDETDDEA